MLKSHGKLVIRTYLDILSIVATSVACLTSKYLFRAAGLASGLPWPGMAWPVLTWLGFGFDSDSHSDSDSIRIRVRMRTQNGLFKNLQTTIRKTYPENLTVDVFSADLDESILKGSGPTPNTTKLAVFHMANGKHVFSYENL